MRRRLTAGGFIMGLVAGLLCTQVLSRPGDQSADERALEWEEMLAKWRQYCAPNKHHNKLRYFTGEWDVTIKRWPDGPDGEPTSDKAAFKAELIFGGRFVKTEVVGSIRYEDLEGEEHVLPFEGLSITGYDSFKGKYVSMWIDSNNTALTVTEGTMDETGSIKYYGRMDEWATGERDKPVLMIDRMVDEDNFVSEFHDLTLPDGRTLVMQMDLERVRPKPDGGGE